MVYPDPVLFSTFTKHPSKSQRIVPGRKKECSMCLSHIGFAVRLWIPAFAGMTLANVFGIAQHFQALLRQAECVDFKPPGRMGH